jgi:hypothetical protein
LQQEIGEASDDAARKYYEDSPKEDRSDTRITTAMRAAAKAKHHSFKCQFFKYLSIANPKFGDKFLEEVDFSFMTPLQDIHIQYRPYTDICGSTDFYFFCSRHPISIKTGSLKFSNK